MTINFKAFEDENGLRQALEAHLRVGSATIEDVLSFCEANKLTYWGPMTSTPKYPEHIQKHQLVIRCRTRAPTGAQEFFKLSNWKIILKKFLVLWMLFFWISEWQIEFYFDNSTLSEIAVELQHTSF
jgi:hypothetical protein